MEPIKHRWDPALHVEVDAETTLRRALAEPGTWDVLRTHSERLIERCGELAQIDQSLAEPAELYDESGRILGYFTPAADRSLDDGPESPHTPEELLRRARQGGGRPLAQILKDLNSKA